LSIIELEARLLQASQQPLLAYSDIEIFRQKMATAFADNASITSNLQYSAFLLGAQSATPGMAFLSGYQSALRCLDTQCPTDQFAAFCVSEKGIKKPWDMETHLQLSASGWRLNGRKGFVMLLPDKIDRLYVVAKGDNDSLNCVRLAAAAKGVSVAESLNAPFIQDIPHAGIVFDEVMIADDDLLTIDAHQQANKPFRYWEDIHVAIAMSAWMLRHLTEDSAFLVNKELMLTLICELMACFEQQSHYYSLAGLDALDECHQLLDKLSENLPDEALSIWKKDRLLLQMGLKIRHQIRLKLTQNITAN